MKFTRPLSCVLMAVSLCSCTLGATLEEDIATANHALAAGNAAGALSSYQVLLEDPRFSKAGSPELWYDRGLAEEKTGDPIAASLSFRRALLLDPTLTVARKALTTVLVTLGVPASAIPSGWREQVLAVVHPELIIVGGAILGWLGILTLVFALMNTPRRAFLIALVLAAIVLGYGLSIAGSLIDPRRIAADEAVVTSKTAPSLRATPADSAATSETLPPGSLITVLSRNGMWWYVADGLGQTGWIPSNTVTPLLPGSVGS